ncbi:MuF-like minor capsid protein [Mycobacterium phage Brownie5]|uniref:MuF-like minor capsid protein n=3 Tax=Rosebushvirus rosebush TaxID=2006145 RepID=A0A649VTT6_9CAUD|nr:MuF-like minor capsid protein [Mycobacterium phage LizLemon]QGJ95614.1 MuF-like minor capsid protein [Mycobacterium phage Brownie5]QGJ95707.1 MuF-like minor capsid protein [Mycobacterium phage Tinciduntsolum]
MWPLPGESIDRDIAFEACVEDLYAEALRRWHPTLKATVLPSITAAGELPPDPDAAQEQAADEWSGLTEAVIVAGLTMLWVATVMEAFDALGIPLPELPDLPRADRERIIATREPWFDDTPVVRRVLSHTGDKRVDLENAADLVLSQPPLATALEEFQTAQRQRALEVPAQVREQLAVRVERANQLASDAGVAPEVARTDVRAATQAAIDPAGEDMREIARTAGYQAASVQNHAILTTALQSEEEGLQKCWIATIDGKTRPTHWAADGQRAPLAGSFIVGGEALAFPADPAGSAREVRNCRCRMGVLAEDEELPSEVDRHTERLNGRDAVARNRQGSQADEIERRKRAGNVRARDTRDGVGTVAASGGWAAPSEQEMAMADDSDTGETFRTFTDAVIALVGEPTSDGRMLSRDIDLSMRTFPHPLMWQEQTDHGHGGSYVIGVVEDARLEDGKVLGSGYLLNNEHADQAYDLLIHKVVAPSVDLAASEWVMTDRDENPVEYDDYMESIENGDPIELFSTVMSAELIGTTLVATAAFGDTYLTLNPERETREVPVVASIVASFTPTTYPAAHFANPELTGPTRTTVTEDGRVFGHIACWDSRHRSVGLGHIDPPRNHSGYREFHTSPPVRLDDGTELAVGRLTVGIGHASTAANVTAAQAAAHYDNADACWALVRVGEDAYGIWFSGVVAPWADQATVEKGASAPLSGDWRDFGNGYELVAALAVNTPGFNVRGTTDSQGRPLAMVASLAPAEHTATGGTDGMTPQDFAAAVAKAMLDQQEAARLAAERDEVLARAAAITQPPTPAEEISRLLEGRG